MGNLRDNAFGLVIAVACFPCVAGVIALISGNVLGFVFCGVVAFLFIGLMSFLFPNLFFDD